jgi:hypothetical protein
MRGRRITYIVWHAWRWRTTRIPQITSFNVKFFSSNEKYNAIYVGNTVSGTWITTQKPKNRKNRETKYVEINNIVYMELYSGAKIWKRNIWERKIASSLYLFTAIGLLPGGSGYLTQIQNMKIDLLLNLRREGYMRSMQWQLGVLGTISALA